MDEYSKEQKNETEDKREEIKQKLRQYYDGRIVRKDLTKSIREGANVPVYVLEYLLGQYCNSDDEEIIAEGVENVKRILRDNYVRPDEAQKILSLLRERGSYTVIDRITVILNTKEDRYEASGILREVQQHVRKIFLRRLSQRGHRMQVFYGLWN